MYLLKEKELFHVHTYRCKHAGDFADEDYIRRAIELGAEKITFTDHTPFPGDRFLNRMAYSQLPEYISSLKELREKYAEQIQIGIGLEVEYMPSFRGYYEELKSNSDIDFLMLGQHMYEVSENLYSYELDDSQGDVLFPRLAESLIDGMESGLFSIVAHPDRVFKTQHSWSTQMKSLSDIIIKSAIEKNILLEINEESKRRRRYYWKEFWDSLAVYQEEYGKRACAIHGLDAHSPGELRLILQNSSL